MRVSEQNEAAGAAWRAEPASMPAADLVLLHEADTQQGYTPTHAWAPRGKHAPRRRRAASANKTVVAGATLDGPSPPPRFDSGMTDAHVAGYAGHLLAPTLRLGQVVADNLRAPVTPAARAAIEARGSELRHSPLCSLDFTLIEHAFSRVEQALRFAEPRTDDVRAATWITFATVTPRRYQRLVRSLRLRCFNHSS